MSCHASMTVEQIYEMLDEARIIITRRDVWCEAHGLAGLPAERPVVQLKVAMWSMRVGLTTEDWTAVAEAHAVVEHLVRSLEAVS